MTARTPVKPNAAHAAMRALVRACLPSLSWRHHGIGVLQAYVAEHQEPEVRVHIWSPKLLKPGMETSGDVHDHRFDLVSHVLAGTVGHEEWHVRLDPEGAYTTTILTHARAAADTKFHGPTTQTTDRLRVRVERMVIPAGYTYLYPANMFHRSPVTGVAVTLVEKHRQSQTPARLLHPIDIEPVMAFGHDVDAALVAEIVCLASDMLKV